MSEANSIDFRANSMDYIRLWAAVTIVYGHSTHWLKVDRVEWVDWINIFPGLLLLFVLSGYLVSASAEHCPDKVEFLKRRFVRIYPGLWVAFAVSAVAVAVMTSLYEIPVSVSDWMKWIAAQVSFFQFYTPPDLKSYGIGNPNGSLWMIPLQVCMYVFIMFTYKHLKRVSPGVWIFLIGILAGLNVASPYIMQALPTTAGKLYFCSPVPYAYIFYIGMFVYVFRKRMLPMLVKYFWCLLLVYAIWVHGNEHFLHWRFGLYVNTVQGILVCFLALGAAYKWGECRLKHDYSYGIYLYHEVFVNILLIGGFVSTWWAIAAVFACTLAVAVPTCRWVEEPVAAWFRKKAAR